MSSEGSQKGIDVKVLKKLLKYMDDAGLVELEIESEGMKVRLKKGGEPQAIYMTPQMVPAMPRPNGALSAPEAVPAAAEASNPNIMRSPMVGTFYRSPSPQSPSFVSTGDDVQIGQTLCVIEAMKLLNEIKAEKAGKVIKILAENGQPVEFDQPLFEIGPVEETPEAG